MYGSSAWSAAVRVSTLVPVTKNGNNLVIKLNHSSNLPKTARVRLYVDGTVLYDRRTDEGDWVVGPKLFNNATSESLYIDLSLLSYITGYVDRYVLTEDTGGNNIYPTIVEDFRIYSSTSRFSIYYPSLANDFLLTTSNYLEFSINKRGGSYDIDVFAQFNLLIKNAANTPLFNQTLFFGFYNKDVNQAAYWA